MSNNLEGQSQLERLINTTQVVLASAELLVDRLTNYNGWGEHSSQRWEALELAQSARAKADTALDRLKYLAWYDRSPEKAGKYTPPPNTLTMDPTTHKWVETVTEYKQRMAHAVDILQNAKDIT